MTVWTHSASHLRSKVAISLREMSTVHVQDERLSNCDCASLRRSHRFACNVGSSHAKALRFDQAYRSSRGARWLLCASLVAIACVHAADAPGIDEIIKRVIGSTPVSFNTKPMEMPNKVAIACGASPDWSMGPHAYRYARVFSNALAAESLREGKPDYPKGSVVAKAKYLDKEGTRLELMTLMRKMEPGYNPKHGDWEYLVTDSRGTTVAQGRLDSCVVCHDRFADKGYVARWFIQAPEGGKR